jgi:hypothetical protein
MTDSTDNARAQERDEALGWRTVAESNQAMAQSWQERAERAEAALATARRDALDCIRKKWTLRDLTADDFSEGTDV